MKKVIKMTTILIMFICTSIVFTSCSTEEKDGPEAELSFVGNWRTQIYDEDEGNWHIFKMILSNDGNYTILNDMGEFDKGTYVVEDDYITLTSSSGGDVVFQILELTSYSLKVKCIVWESFGESETMDIQWFREVNHK